MQPVTEASNDLSRDIDIASPADIVSILYQCDQEVFNGFLDYKCMFHSDVLRTLQGISSHIADVIKNPEDAVVLLSGCGTSGRLGFVTARTLNERLSSVSFPGVYRYLIAGGDKALFTSQEAPEDDPVCGVKALKEVCIGKSKVVFIGITCGLSAPFVGGQLEYCMENPDVFTPVLLGFNPTDLARNIKIGKWESTFLQVTRRLESRAESGTGFILNPVVGPEPITGSSRMKSGTATKMLLEAACVAAQYSVFQPDRPWNISSHLKVYKIIREAVHQQAAALSHVVEMAAHSLTSGGSIYYLGNDSLGLVGIIDASECPPTYGATLDDVRGFTEGGYTMMRNTEGDLSSLGRHFRISTQDFKAEVTPTLTERDTVILLNTGKSWELPEYLQEKRCKKVLLTLHKVNTDACDAEMRVNIPFDEVTELIGQEPARDLMQLFYEMATKWCLNTVSTGAHVLQGKVYRNMMIDVKVSNNKLFHRAIGILEKVGRLTGADARRYLLQSIYETDSLSREQETATIAEHIQVATVKNKVVPVALVSAVSKVTVADAHEMLMSHPAVRSAVHSVVESLDSAPQ